MSTSMSARNAPRSASALLMALALASCAPAPHPPASSEGSRDPANAIADRATPAAPAETPAQAASRERQARHDRDRDEAMRDAVAAVHAYLRHAGARERVQAEARWAHNRLPPVGEEAGLRTLPLRALRIENGTPRALDAEPVPASIEVPVQLRASLEDGTTHRYTGWYRVRRNPVTTTWELTATSLQPVLR